MILFRPSNWTLDETTGQISVTLYEAPPDDHPDPVSFTPTKKADVTIDPTNVTVTNT